MVAVLKEITESVERTCPSPELKSYSYEEIAVLDQIA